jgi:hypothetical protein
VVVRVRIDCEETRALGIETHVAEVQLVLRRIAALQARR